MRKSIKNPNFTWFNWVGWLISIIVFSVLTGLATWGPPLQNEFADTIGSAGVVLWIVAMYCIAGFWPWS